MTQDAPSREQFSQRPLRVLMITSSWPSEDRPSTTHFIKRQADFLVAAGVQLEVYRFSGGGLPWRYLAAWLGAQARLVRGSYDLVHAQFGQSGLLALPRRVPLVVTLRGSDILGIVRDRDGSRPWSGRVLKWLSRQVTRRADAVIVVSEHMKASLPPSVDATVIASGIDLSLFQPMPQAVARRRLGLRPDVPIVLFAGRPDQARKRHKLAAATVEVLRRSKEVELLVAWGVRHADMPLYMNAADVLLFTSMQEGSPNVVKEALACGLPVVSVPVGDVPVRLEGVPGCEVCPDERPEALAEAVGRALSRRRRLESHALVEDLDEHRQTARVIAVYREVLAKRRSARPLPAV